MLELIQELDTASSLINDAIQRYVTACYAINNFYGKTTGLSGVPQALSDRVANELVSVTSYETEVKRARSAICQARNCSPTVTPIQTLPTEVLARIFQIVVGARPCNTNIQDDCHTNIHIPKYPDFLSHVCSRWRQIALGLPALWSHIDLIYSHSLSRGFTSRAAACAARAGHLPLDIHIRQALEDADDETIFDFLTTFAERVGLLELALPDSETSEDFATSLLQCLLGKCTPGIFTKLAIVDRTDHSPRFIKAQARDPEDVVFGSIWLPLATERFETVMLPVTVLRLHGLYPLWTSRAYQGLVELHLTCTPTPNLKVSQSELYQILDNNPKLQVLEFGLDIIIDSPSESLEPLNLPPLHLEHLEVLNLSTLEPEELDVLLSFIAPGLNPLQLRIYYHENASLLTEEHELIKFFKRSNITKLYMGGYSACPPVGELVNLLPNLYVLVLDGFDDDDDGEQRRKLSQEPKQCALSTPSSLHKLYVMECRLDFATVKQAIKQYSIQELILWDSGIHHGDLCVPDNQVVVELSRLCPAVRIISNDDPSPIEDWD